jgi:glycosyltransferase involved in cell wall biosynthesis
LPLQEGDPIEDIKKTMLPLYPLFVRGFTKADFVQAISNYLGNWARDMGFEGPLEVIQNAVDVKHFSREYTDSELQALKQKLGKNKDDVFLITTSRLVKKNAVDDVIKSLKHLPENILFIVLGDGPDKEKLLKLAEDIGVKDRVEFLGHIEHSEMPKYLKVSDIFIRPSLSEGMGNSFVEAMAAGLPIIATQEGGIMDFLFDPDRNSDKKPTGRAVNTRDPEGIAGAVKLYLKDKEKTQEIIKNARELAFDKYDWDLIAKNMKEKVFDKLLK